MFEELGSGQKIPQSTIAPDITAASADREPTQLDEVRDHIQQQTDQVLVLCRKLRDTANYLVGSVPEVERPSTDTTQQPGAIGEIHTALLQLDRCLTELDSQVGRLPF